MKGGGGGGEQLLILYDVGFYIIHDCSLLCAGDHFLYLFIFCFLFLSYE